MGKFHTNKRMIESWRVGGSFAPPQRFKQIWLQSRRCHFHSNFQIQSKSLHHSNSFSDLRFISQLSFVEIDRTQSAGRRMWVMRHHNDSFAMLTIESLQKIQDFIA